MTETASPIQAYKDGLEYDDPSVKLAAGSVISLTELQQSQVAHGPKMTTYRWNSEHYPIKSTETVAYLARRILNANVSSGFSSVIMIGKSGTGKSSFTGTLSHRLHKQAEDRGISYAFNWYRRDDIGKIDQIIQSLEKGVNRIIVFEDASWGDRELSELEAQQLLARLTYIRHDLQANCIVIIQIHWSKALGPFIRDGEFLVLTSISHIERENYLKLFGKNNQSLVNSFFKKYGSMNTEGYWYADQDEVNRLCYYTKKPFKLALVSDFNQLHFTQYPRESCGYCEPRFQTIPDPKYVESASEKELFHQLAESYGVSKVRQALRYFTFFRTGANCLEPKSKALISRLVSYYEKHPDDWQNTSEELKLGRSIDQLLRQRGLTIKVTNEEKRIAGRAKKAVADRQRYLKKKEQGN